MERSPSPRLEQWSNDPTEPEKDMGISGHLSNPDRFEDERSDEETRSDEEEDDQDLNQGDPSDPSDYEMEHQAFEDWDNGEDITQAEREALLAMGSNYERSHVMNIRRHQRFEVECGLRGAVVAIMAEINAPANSGKTTNKPSKATKAATLLPPRRSGQHSGGAHVLSDNLSKNVKN